MDVHVDYGPDFVRQCVRVLERTGADNVGGVARPRARTFFQRCVAAALRSPMGIGGSTRHKSDREGFVESVKSGAFRRTVFERAGLFDPHAIDDEDADWNHRLAATGGRGYLSRDIVSHYHPRGSWSALARQYYGLGQGRARTLLKHRRLPSLRSAIPFLGLVGDTFPLAVAPLNFGGCLLPPIPWRPEPRPFALADPKESRPSRWSGPSFRSFTDATARVSASDWSSTPFDPIGVRPSGSTAPDAPVPAGVAP